MPLQAPIGLYIHIPFCKSKCAYCDFASWPGREGDMRAYVDAVIAEAAHYTGRTADTVFLGGGTPAVLPDGEVARLLVGVRAAIHFAPGAECTIEVNPNSLTAQKAREYADAGVNRMSMGLQAVQPRLLKLLGRTHTADDLYGCVELARAAGIVNINVDLMYSLPTQTVEEAAESARFAAALDVAHISAYALKLEPGTPLHAQRPALPDDDADRAMFYAIRDELASAGLARYEISNFAKPGYACAHNLKYWRMQDYAGLGASAHSCMDGVRFWNARALDDYLAGGVRVGEEPTEPQIERLMLGLRLAEGVPRALLPHSPTFAARVERLVRGGLAVLTDDALVLTDRGMDVQNAVVVSLLD